MLVGIIAAGTVGFVYLEGWSYFDAWYFTVIYLSTIGLGDLSPQTDAGRFFAVILAILGVGFVAFSIGQFSKIFVEMQVQKIFGRRKLEQSAKNIHDHYIVCGYGRIGKFICQELLKNKHAIVVIDRDPLVVDQLRADYSDVHALLGDATDESLLLEAGITRAKGLVTSTSHDAENVYIVLTARDLCPDLHLISVASDERAAEKIKRAGANSVVAPSRIGGDRIVQAILRPSVLDFIDLVVYDSELELQMEQLEIRANSPLCNKSLRNSSIRQKYDVIILSIKSTEGDMMFNPSPDYTFVEGDVLVAVGKTSDLKSMAEGVA